LKKIVVVGGGHAAAQFCAAVLETKQAVEITLITEETYLPYQRPPLSKTYIKEDDPQPAWLRPASFYADNQINIYMNSCVTALHREEKSISVNSGDRFSYDVLVLAIGTRARVHDLFDTRRYSNVFTLRNMDDANGLRAQMGDARNVLVIGGGFIGLEIAATSRAMGKNVSVLEAAPRLLGRSVSTEVSDYLLNKHRSEGVEILLDAKVDKVDEQDGRVTAAWVGDTRYDADVVVVGIGAVPNVELAQAAGLECDNGIMVNSFMQTSDEAIYAIGDCTNFPYEALSCRLRLESVQNANDQARCAARAIFDDPMPYTALPWFWSDQGRVRIQIAGVPHASHVRLVRGNPADDKFSVLYFDDNKLTCTESVNMPIDHMAARKLISTAIQVDPGQAADPQVALKSLSQAS
jgi:3-phenylpropionate/trans-cinnamate dioxygenase ferredoxin reductase subunit|tara:strand:+ start:192329 stop:193549 length:1221 start_codon:yes stop_codon:yes gene_type:complete